MVKKTAVKKKTGVKQKATKKTVAGKSNKKPAPVSKPGFEVFETATAQYLELWKSGTKKLEHYMSIGSMPSMRHLDGWRFRCLNVGPTAKLLGIQKFIKCFYNVDYHFGSMLTGHNISVEQNAPSDINEKKMKNGVHKIQGYYLVESENRNFNKYQNAALLHYGRADNHWWEPAKRLRDYLVQPFADNANILLGKAFFAIGPFQVFGGYFVLERLEKHDEFSK